MLMMYRSSQNSEAIEKVANAEVTEETAVPAEESANAEEEAATEQLAEPTIWMPNPAAVYCEEQGWTVSIVKDEEGNESGMCKLADGTEVDEWEYYRANNKESDSESTNETTNEEATAEAAEETAAETIEAEATTWDTAEAWTGEVATWASLATTGSTNE